MWQPIWASIWEELKEPVDEIFGILATEAPSKVVLPVLKRVVKLAKAQ